MFCLLQAGIGSEEEPTQDSTPDILRESMRFGVYESAKAQPGCVHSFLVLSLSFSRFVGRIHALDFSLKRFGPRSNSAITPQRSPLKIRKSFCHAGSDFPKEQANGQSESKRS